MKRNLNLIIPNSKPNASLNLICFPYAGGGTQTYLPWAQKLPEHCQLIIVQPPGRGSDFNSPPQDNVKHFIRALITILAPDLNKPYVLFGHSLGSRMAFEFMYQVSKLSFRLPQHFIASGSRAPNVERTSQPIHNLPEQEFLTELENLNGTPRAVLENKELMSIYAPILRADFKMAETYLFDKQVSFPVPLTVFGGEDDIGVSHEHLTQWQSLFNGESNIHILAGDHFFIDSNQEDIIQRINRVLTSTGLKSML